MSPKGTKIFTRVMAVFLACLMLGGVMLAAFQSFAIGPQFLTLSIPLTGDTNTKYWIIGVAVAAVVLLAGATVLPKMLKKK